MYQTLLYLKDLPPSSSTTPIPTQKLVLETLVEPISIPLEIFFENKTILNRQPFLFMIAFYMKLLQKPWIPITILIILYLITVCLRGYQDFSNYLLPGINGGYYAVQVRSILETGKMAYFDTPLVFYAEAALAILLKILTSFSLQETIMFSIRFFDTFIPPLIIFPIYLLAKRNLKIKNIEIASLALAIISGLHIFILQGLSGDFAKNAIALFLLALLLAYLYSEKPKLYITILILILCGLTHKSGAGLGLIFIAIHLFSTNKFVQKLSHKGITIFAIISLVIQSIITSITEQSVLAFLLSGFRIISNENYLGLIFTWIILGIICFSLIKSFKAIPKENYLHIVSYILLTFCLSSIFLGKSYAERIWFLSAIPFIVSIIFSFKYISETARIVIVTLLVVLSIFSVQYFLEGYKLPLLKQAAYIEIKENLKPTENSVTIADHGINWWASWATGVKTAEEGYLTSQQLIEFDRIYYISYYPNKELYSWFGDVNVPQKAQSIYKGEYIEIHKCTKDCYEN